VNEEPLRFHQESWSLKDITTPSLVKTTTIPNVRDSPSWSIRKTLVDDNKQLAGPRVSSFTPDLAYLRIGHQLFSKDSRGEYIGMDTLSGVIEKSSTHFEEITNRDRYLVLTSRRRSSTNTEIRGRTANRDHGETTSGKQTPLPEEAKEDEDDIEKSSTFTSSEESEWNSAEESWSEGSTETDEDDKMHLNATDSSEENQKSASSSEADSEDEDEMLKDEIPVHSFGQLKQESDSDGGDIDFNHDSEDDAYNGDSDSSNADSVTSNVGFKGDKEDMPKPRLHLPRPPKPAATDHKGLLMIYDLQSGNPVQVFKYSQDLPVALYDSPPVIHPTKPLVVWPLCGGELLFVNIEGKSYFVRKARPSTPRSPPSFPSHA